MNLLNPVLNSRNCSLSLNNNDNNNLIIIISLLLFVLCIAFLIINVQQ